MFYIIRIVIGFLICTIVAVAIIRMIRKKALLIISLIFIVMLIIASMFIPVENLFVTFSTPETAYRYLYSKDPVLKVAGETSDFMVSIVDNNTVNIGLFSKTESGWKLGLGSDIRLVYSTIEDGVVFDVYQFKNQEEYYISVLPTKENVLIDISDNRQSEFYHLEFFQSYLKQPYYMYYAYVKDFNETYSVKINDKAYKIVSEKN